ncbi:MAG: uracil-DNA glycosylase family protein [Proteobacteria bacterium]|uniref:uracil-DNA glycosylase family protein n=1 Tax=Rudaea sp. TaxID=2136325 RepID=UPI001D5EE75B|nr:uracil-DNA glycosylase family protein [Pseudomonadota bacterium]MBS0567337.1 uracil-DNA glycosylase family protein [Pseudomonadota bacterium]
MQTPLSKLLKDIRACTHCAASLPCGPRPVLQAHASARLLIVGQAPGRKVHETGIPWDDASGDTLRDWLGLTPAQFYDASKVAIMPMGFCYPGRGRSGDLPPRPQCAPRWHEKLNARMPGIALTLLVGRYAQVHYLADRRKTTLGDTVKAWKNYFPSGHLPLPHPSPRNRPWCVRNPWFEQELVPELRALVRSLEL